MVEFSQIQSAYKSLKKISGDTKLVHYTTTEVLDKILLASIFRASNILYLNDAEEYRNGKNVIEDYLKKSDQSAVDNLAISDTEIYTISFCKEEDLLSQWITYAKESGVAIELDSELLKFNRHGDNFYFCIGAVPIGQADSEFDSQRYLMGDVLSELDYIDTPNEQFRTDMNEVLHASGVECLEETDKTNFYELKASYIKNPKFNAESEIRASFLSCKSQCCDNESYTHIKHFRMSNGVLRPYIEAKICIWSKDIISPCLPLKSIVVGPSGVQQTVFNSVVHRIKYGECNVYNYLIYNRQKFADNFAEYLAAVEAFLIGNAKMEPRKCRWSSEKGIEQLFEFVDRQPESVKNVLNALTYEWIELNKSYIAEQGIQICGITEYKYDTKDKLDIIKNNFYFTKEGILIKKSKIPYIF